MENRNCKNCGKVFRYVTGYPLCDQCKDKDDQEYRRIKAYIREHPGRKIEEVAEALNISPHQILRYLREERFEVPGKSEKFIDCEFCGKAIRTGRFCDHCKSLINKELNMPAAKTLGDTYYYNEEEERKIQKLKNNVHKD